MFLIALSFFYACETDDYQSLEESDSTYTIELRKFSDLKTSNLKLYNLLTSNPNPTTRFSVSDSLTHSRINSEYYKYLRRESDGYESYTFYINPLENEMDTIKNLWISTYGDSYKVMLANFSEPTAPPVLQFSNNYEDLLQIECVPNIVTICDEEWQQYQQAPPDQGQLTGLSPGESIEYDTYWVLVSSNCNSTYIDCGSGGSSSDTPPLNGGGWGGGSGEGSNNNYEPPSLSDDEIISPIYINPVEDPEEEEEGPCYYLNNMSKEKPYLNVLEGKINSEREYGYYYDNATYVPEASLHDDRPNELDMPTGGTIYGCSHTHPSPELTDKFPMFSIQDIMWLGYAYSAHDKPKPPPEKLFTTLTVKNGTEVQHFAIKIEDFMSFINSVNVYAFLSKDKKEDLDNNLISEYDIIEDNGGGYTNYAKTLYKFLDEFDINGIAIYKAEDDLSNWSKLPYDSENEVILNEEPCN